MKFLILCSTHEEIEEVKSRFNKLQHSEITLISCYNSIDIVFDLYDNTDSFSGYDRVICFKSGKVDVYEKPLEESTSIDKTMDKLFDYLKEDKKESIVGMPSLNAKEVFKNKW